MVQKVIKIGSSLGITIPKKQAMELGIGLGDEVKIKIEPLTEKDKKQEKLMQEYEKFVEQYGQTLRNLADR